MRFKTVAMEKLTVEQAIAIANCDKYLKTSIYNSWKKNMNIELGFIRFISFNVCKVYMGERNLECWLVKVKDGDWGGAKPSYEDSNRSLMDGVFIENEESCLIHCDTGTYWYKDEFDESELREVPNWE